MDIQSLFEGFTSDHVKAIMVGTSVDLGKINDLDRFRDAAVHCCLNGPVGTGKLTTFPGHDEEVKIKDLYNGRLSNKMWRNFCRVVAEHLVRNYEENVTASQQYKLFNGVWPLHEDDE